MHSAAWKPDTDLSGKVVAVLGSGSSAIQIVPTIQPEVKHLTTFIRSPTWVTAGFAQSKAGPGGTNFDCELADLKSRATLTGSQLHQSRRKNSQMSQKSTWHTEKMSRSSLTAVSRW